LGKGRLGLDVTVWRDETPKKKKIKVNLIGEKEKFKNRKLLKCRGTLVKMGKLGGRRGNGKGTKKRGKISSYSNSKGGKIGSRNYYYSINDIF